MTMKSVLLLYGLPCSGKSSVVASLPDHSRITVDEIITSFILEPSVADFRCSGNEIVDKVVTELQNQEATQFVIEMGCLIPRLAISRLEAFMNDNGFLYTNILLAADDDELIRRIKQRNADIDAGKSDSIKVDGPDYLTRFKAVFDDSQPDSCIEIDTTALNFQEIIEQIINT